MTKPPLNILSLGAGVQSTTMALLAAHGLITPMPDCAIFADTQWEPRAVYDHLNWLCSDNVLPFPVHRISRGNIKADILASRNATGQRFASVPWFLAGGGLRRPTTSSTFSTTSAKGCVAYERRWALQPQWDCETR